MEENLMSFVERMRDASTRSVQGETAETKLGEYGALVNGQWLFKTGDAIEVHSPYDDSLVAVVHRAGPDEIERAIAAAVEAFKVTRKLPSWKRAEILEKISQGIAGRRDEFAQTIALEAGKPVRTARIEVDRAVFVFKIAAEESKRI
jgi:acyl-CoA reductase-like NAD-dependent aldehyde dehydrogenase